MPMVRIRFLNDEDHTRGAVGLAKRMTITAFRGGYYVVPEAALQLLDEWACQYEIVERGGYDALVVNPLRSVAAGQA